MLAGLAVFGVPAALAQVATTTTLALSSASVTPGTVVTFTAAVSNGSVLTTGLVTFCDSRADYPTYCDNSAIVGTAQLTSAGTAIINLIPGAGSHSYTAVFNGVAPDAPSTSSPAQALTVAGHYPTTTTIAASGAGSSYALTGTVLSTGSKTLSPTGTISFLDISDGNDVLGTVTLGAGVYQAFGAPVSYQADIDSIALATGDFNGDGHPDLVAVNFQASTASVYLGSASGTLSAQNEITTDAWPSSVAVGDFNGDGKLDFAVTVNGQMINQYGFGTFDYNAVDVFLGNGDGTFQSSSRYSTGVGPEFVAVGDFNGDGIPDMAVANNTDNTVSILLGNSGGGFQGQVTYTVGNGPIAIAVGDFNGDGFLDLAVANSSDTTVSVLLGNGDGTFQPQTIFQAGHNPYSIAAGDFRGIGKLDLAVGNGNGNLGFMYQPTGSGDNTVSVLLNTSAGGVLSFTGQAIYATGSGPSSIAVADINGDGKADLAVSNGASGTVGVLLGVGDGTFQPQVTYPVGNGPDYVALADFNGDGYPDLAVASGSQTVSVLLNSVTQTVAPALTGFVMPDSGSPDLIEASYSGDTNFLPSVSGTIPAPTGTTLGLTPNLTSSTLGQPVTLTATLNPFASGALITDGELVTFASGTIALGTGTLSSGVATLTLDSLPGGSDNLTAIYSGDSYFLASAAAMTFPVNQVPLPGGGAGTTGTDAMPDTTTVLTTSAGEITVGASVTFTATVTPADATGTITFFANGISLGSVSMAGGAAQIGTSFASAGTYSIAAGYSGDGTYNGSPSVPVLEVVDEVGNGGTGAGGPTGGGGAGSTGNNGLPNTTTVLTSSAAEITVGGSVTFTANVTPTAATGSVSFFDNGGFLGKAPIVGGAAQWTTTTLTAGTQSILAAYDGSTSYNQSQSAPVLEVVDEVGNGGTGAGGPAGGGGAGTTGNNGLPNTTTVLTSSAAEITVGGSITFTANVTPPAATGTVSFFDNGGFLGTAPIVSGTAQWTTTTLTAGTQSILAAYDGSTSYNQSQSVPVLEVVDEVGNGGTGAGGPAGGGGAGTTGNNGLPNTTTVLTSSAAEITVGGSVTFTANVTPAAATGSVSFFDNNSFLGTATVTNGVAQWTTTALIAGRQSILAAYDGSTSYNQSQSAPVLEVVDEVGNGGTGVGGPAGAGGAGTTGNNGLPNTTTVLTSSAAEITVGGSVTFTANVTPAAATGSVSFFDNNSFLGTATVTNGVAQWLTTALAAGTQSILAGYSGSASYNGSQSVVIGETVGGKITPVIAWAAPAAITLGTALSSTQLNATASVPGTFAYTPAARTIPATGSDILSATFTPTNTAEYTPAAGTIPAIGLDTLTVVFTPTDSVDYTTATASVVLTVGDFFSLNFSSSPIQTVQPGAAASYSLTVAPIGLARLPAEVTFTATGLPPDATITFSPATIPAGSPATEVAIAIHTSSRQAANTGSSQRSQGPAALGILLLPMLGIAGLRKRLGKIPQFRAAVVLGVLSLGAIMGLTGCGAVCTIAPQPTQTSYTVVITAHCGTLLHSADVTVKVEN
jgi:hypothetical protein